MSTFDEAVAMWETFRAGVIAELENIPEESWDFRPVKDARSVLELGQHIAQMAEAFATELCGPEPQFISVAGKARELAVGHSKQELIEYLKAKRFVGTLRGCGDTIANGEMKSFGKMASRLTGLWFAISHEAYHRGQLATYARALGIVPALTQQMQQMQQKR
jgi:uncharacterized damage-inducible protein DinB